MEKPSSARPGAVSQRHHEFGLGILDVSGTQFCRRGGEKGVARAHMLLAVEECVSPWYGTLVSFASVPMSLHPLSRNTNT